MCGIAGLFLKDQTLQPQLGAMMAGMLGELSERGPDSAGFAVYGAPESLIRLTLRTDNPTEDFPSLERGLTSLLGADPKIDIRDTHGVLHLTKEALVKVLKALAEIAPGVSVMSWGSRIEIYKEAGHPSAVTDRFDLASMSGTHAVGHTRMATESAVTTMGAHPFSTGADECLVHNGSLSNHNALRRELVREGMSFETENDSEVAAAYLSHRMSKGANLGEALTTALDDLDGFYTFVVGTADGFGVLRDPIACKPAVLAETDQYVAFGSEYRALAELPGIETARVWEPEPATVYFWSH